MKGRRDALVIGGGPAGAAAATHLAQAGRDVLVIEKEPGPHHKVCGEFISIEAQAHLRRIGVDAAALGAVPVEHVRLVRGATCIEAPLPFRAVSLSRLRLDEALLECARRSGATILRGERIVRFARADGGWRAETDRGGVHEGRALFLATGKHELRGAGRRAGWQEDLIGFKLHWRTPAPLPCRVDLFLFRGGYGGLEPVEGGEANLCLLVRRAVFAALGRRWEALLEEVRRDCPMIDGVLAGSEPVAERPSSIFGIPYGFLASNAEDGLYRIGDQMAVIPSFAGDGIAIALHSAALAAGALLDGSGPKRYAAAARHAFAGPVRLATLLSLIAVRRPGQAAIMAAAAALPMFIPAIASRTRISRLERGPSGPPLSMPQRTKGGSEDARSKMVGGAR